MAFLEMKGISKYFGPLAANDNVSLSVGKGEIHALLGENGAGKTTLMNILYGVYGASAGEIYLDGAPLHVHSPKDALEKGIGMVHQHFMLIPALTVIENVVLGLKQYSGVLKLKQAAAAFESMARRFGMSIDPFAKVESLSVGQQQRVEILKALFRQVGLLILDEPTAVLTPQEVHELFHTIKKLTEDGLTIIFISHKLAEIMDACTRCTILRQGRVVATVNTSDIQDRSELAAMMVGHEIAMGTDKADACPGEEVLRVENLSCRDKRGVQSLCNVSLSVRAGEILGVCGVDGNGQSELVRCIAGLMAKSGGTVVVNGRDVSGAKPKKIRGQGMAHIPEDRHKTGMVAGMTVNENLALVNYRETHFCRQGFLRWKEIRRHNQQLCETYKVKIRSIDDIMKTLSGGNQQKCVVGRELDTRPSLLVAMHPDRGLDVGATKYIQSEIVAARDAGAAVLLVSTELEEIMELSDRILVLYGGRVMAVIAQREATVEKLGLLMAGIREEETP